MQPDTRDARSGDIRIAYQVIGHGPRDLVFVPGIGDPTQPSRRAA